MLPKKNRADTHDVEKIFKEGKFINSPSITFKYVFAEKSSAPRISFVAPKSIAKLAVKRNLLRRRGYAALVKQIEQFPLGIIGVFVFKKPESDMATLENEIKTILHKIR